MTAHLLRILRQKIKRHQTISDKAKIKAEKLMDEYKSCMSVVDANNKLVSKYEFQIREFLNSK